MPWGMQSPACSSMKMNSDRENNAGNSSQGKLGVGHFGPATVPPSKDVKAKGKVVNKIYTKAPPGMEDMVMELKKQYGEDSSTPFKIAWDDYSKGKK